MKYLIFILILFSFSCKPSKDLTMDTTTNEEFLKTKYGNRTFINGPIDIANIEKAQMTVIVKKGKSDTIPFGYINKEWLKIKRKYKKGDEFFHFRTNAASWAALCGREGYVLIRKKRIISSIIFKLS